MKTQTNEPPKPHRLRDDPTFLGLYTSIIASFYSQWDFMEEADGVELEELNGKCRSIAQLAYLAACFAKAQLDLAEPAGPDEEIQEFNAILNPSPSPKANGETNGQ